MRKTDQVNKVLDLWIPRLQEEYKIPGVSISVFCDLREVILYNKNITDNQKFRVASFSKLVTAVAILKLVEDGKVKLSDRVEKYISGFKNTFLFPIRIKDLLSHTSGLIRDNRNHWGDGNFCNEYELLEFYKEDKNRFIKGEFKYSNYGYALLGLIIKKVSGVEYNVYIKEVLKINNIFPDLQDDIFLKSTNSYSPATGCITTPRDYNIFLQQLFSGKIINQKSLKLLVTPRGVVSKKDAVYYGLGITIQKHSNKVIYTHTGSFMGYSAYFLYEPQAKISIVTCFTTTKFLPTDLVYSLFDIITSESNIDDEYIQIFKNEWGELITVPVRNTINCFYTDSFVFDGEYKNILVSTDNKDVFKIHTSNYGPNHENATFQRNEKGDIVALEFGKLVYKKYDIR